MMQLYTEEARLEEALITVPVDCLTQEQMCLQCLNEDVLSPMVACIRKMPRLMASEALSHLWPDKAPAGTDLAGSIIGNAVLNTCRSGLPYY